MRHGTAVLAVLLSGAVRGEAGRMFIPWMSLWMVAAAAPEPGGAPAPPGTAARPPRAALAALLALRSVALLLLLRVP